MRFAHSALRDEREAHDHTPHAPSPSFLPPHLRICLLRCAQRTGLITYALRATNCAQFARHNALSPVRCEVYVGRSEGAQGSLRVVSCEGFSGGASGSGVSGGRSVRESLKFPEINDLGANGRFIRGWVIMARRFVVQGIAR